MRVMDFGHKKCRIKVFEMFCYLDGKNGVTVSFRGCGPWSWEL